MTPHPSRAPARPIIGYIRVSTKRQAREGVSLKDQEHRIREWARRAGTESAAIYRDAISGRTAANRPGLQRALDEVCRAHGVLVVYSLSRLARSVRDAIDISERLAAAGADLVSLTDPIDTTTAMGRAFFAMMAVMARLESDLISERVRSALAYKRGQMLRTTSVVPYGFRLAADKAHLVVDRKEQAVIARMKRWRRGGKSYWSIASRLNREGVPTRFRGCRPFQGRKPSGRKATGSAWQLLNQANRGRWNAPTVRRIILRKPIHFESAERHDRR
jgi:site-specific DNA recombinase